MKEFTSKSVGVGILLIAALAVGCVSERIRTTPSSSPSAVEGTAPADMRTAATDSATTSGKVAQPVVAEPYAELPPLEGDNWESLFDGVSLDGWKVTDFAGHGSVDVKNGLLVLEMGAMLTGVNLLKTNDIPAWDYELALDAMKLAGQDFFCGLTFVVGDSCCSFIVGGWGGGLVGISSIDGSDASMNETTKYKAFEPNKWYRIRVRVTRNKLEAWIGREKMVDVELEGKRITVRPGEIEENQPFGLCTYQTTGAYRNIQWRRLK